jgi:hypothetical protein
MNAPHDPGAPVLPVLAGLFDDAAVFPPGSLPLEQAVPAHVRHTRSAHAELVGAFVLTARDIARLAELTAALPEHSFGLSVTVALPDVSHALAAARRIPAVRLVGLEVAVPDGVGADTVVPALAESIDDDTGLTVYVEVPRDARREPLLAALAGTPYLAKLRTGGVRADLYPDECELAATVLAAVRAGVAFKATAGLHHALRTTDPETGFEQHGFLNLLVATDAAVRGAEEEELVQLLADRDGDRIAARVRGLSPRVRDLFRSFGTCSVAEPAAESAALGLLPATTIADLTEVSA